MTRNLNRDRCLVDQVLLEEQQVALALGIGFPGRQVIELLRVLLEQETYLLIARDVRFLALAQAWCFV